MMLKLIFDINFNIHNKNMTTSVPGLYIQENIITIDTEIQIVNWLDTREWSTTLPRRTQHFGYQYNYTNTDLVPGDSFEGPIKYISDRLVKYGVIDHINQCIVNEYTRDQKIGKHIDGKRGNRPNIFGPKIISISLTEDTNLIFCNPDTKEKVEIYVPRRCMVVMTGDSRYIWTHEIPKRLSVNINGKNVKKGDNYRRVSLTFRSVK